MANKGGIVTRKDMFSDDAMKFGEDYAKQLNVAIDANKILVDSVKELNKQVQNFKVANNQKDYITAKQAEALATQQAIDAIKKQEVAELSLDKIERSRIATIEAERKAKQAATDAENKLQKTKQASVKLTLEERVANEANNKVLKYEARERLGLVSAYEKLNKARLDAQKRLAELLSAEKQNIAEIIVAQREFDKLDARVKAVDEAIKNYSKNIGNYSSAFEGLTGTFRDLIAAFGLVTGIELFGVVVKDVFSIIRDFDRQLIAVGKTINITGEDLKQFGREVVDLGDKLDGITVDGLIQSAEVAGQLGVTGTPNILKFSEAIEKLKLTSNIISEEQVGQFAKFIEVSSDSFDNADKLASVITQLGNSFATTEAEVLANSTEIQKGISVYNSSAQGVLALGAATSTLGSEAEVSASSIQKAYGVIDEAVSTGKNLDKVLKLTDLSQKELSKQFNKDATGVFVKFVKGLSDARSQGENLRGVLKELNLDETRTFKVIGSLAANYGILESAMAQANKEYVDNAALNKEVAAASESIDSIIGDLVDKWEAYVLQTNDANNGTEALTKTLKFLRDNFKDIINFVLKAGAVLFAYLGTMKLVNFATVAGTAIQTAWTVGQIRFALATGVGTQSILAQAAAARAAMVAQEGLNVAVKATPWGLILGLLSAVIVAYMVFNDEMSQAEKNIQNIVDANKRLQESEKTYASDRDKNRSEDFKGIEYEIKLRKAKGENLDKLDKEEIGRKKEILQAQISVYSDLKNVELERTKTEISNSRQRIAQMEIERKDLQKSGYRVNKQGRNEDDLSDLIASEKDKLNSKKASLTENSRLTIEEQTRLGKLLQDLDKDAEFKDAEFKAEEDKKAIAARKRHLRNLYDARKKAFDDEFKLSQFRLQVAIDMENEIATNEKSSYDDRIDALYDATQLMAKKTKEAAIYELKSLGKYNENSGKFIRELSDFEIKTLVETGKAKKKLTSEQQLIYEKFQNEQTKIAKKQEEDRLKLIDSQIAAIQKLIDAELLLNETKLNKTLEAENILFLNNAEEKNRRKREEAIDAHERKIYEIKKHFALDGLKVQIDALQRELDINATKPIVEQISADKRKEIEAQLQKAKTEYSQIGYEKYLDRNSDSIEQEKYTAEKILDISGQLTNALSGLTNAIFETKIQNIDNEISKNNEYYDKQIELAGNDERQKELLQKERDKKNDELEKKKRKEQHKQAVYNKAVTIAQIGLQTALAIITAAAATAPTFWGVAIAATLGAVELGAAIATAIPKYKHGRKGGPAEFAEVGDGFVHEIIEKKDGRAFMTPNKPTLTYLEQGDKVHSTVDDYYKLQRAAMMSSIDMQGRKMSDFQATQNFENAYGKELLEELKKNTEAVKRQKTGTVVNVPKLDINYHLWKMKNTNWN
jgi:hypothetical protein